MSKIDMYTGAELTNERYHSAEFPQHSGSKCAEILETCPAEFEGKERVETKALADGTAAHCTVLEPKLFKSLYARGINPADYPNALDGNKAFMAWLTERGIKCSGKTKEELLKLIEATDEKPQILDYLIEGNAAENQGLIILNHDTYDMVIAMRTALKRFGYTFNGGMQYEVSLIGERFKCRIDILVAPGAKAPDGEISKNGELWDYKSARDVEPEYFGKESVNRWYWLKMAIQADMFEAKFGVPPDRVVLLAQSKTKPYLAQAYQLTEEQLNAGREDYLAASELIDHCKSTGEWFGYGGGVIPLQTPGWEAAKRGFESNAEGGIEFIED